MGEDNNVGKNVPDITIISDHPIEEQFRTPHKDTMNFNVRLKSILDILRHKNTECPMTIGIYGDWGTGKTSAMTWLKSRLNDWNTLKEKERQGHPKVYSIWFEPWKYSTREDVWRGLIAEVIIHCVDLAEIDKENARTRIIQAAKQFGRFLGKSFLHALANTTIKGKIPGVEAEIKGELFKDVIDEFHKTNEPQKAYLNEFEHTFRDWITNYLDKDKERMAVFIDDLDRCLPEVTLEVLEALKLYLNIENLVFIVGLDRTVIDGVLKKHYEKYVGNADKSREYLGKIFQVEIQVSPSEQQLEGYYENQVKDLNKKTKNFWNKNLDKKEYKDIISKAIKALSRNNPREIKRLLNSSLIYGHEASESKDLTDDTHKGLSNENKEKIRFAQGIQVCLIQRRLSDFPAGAAILCRTDVQEWFSNVSKIIRDKNFSYEEFEKNIKTTDTEDLTKEEERKHISSEKKKKAEKILPSPPQGINYTIINKEWLFSLLKIIPFSISVASSSAIKIKESEIEPMEEKSREIVDSLPEPIQTAIVTELDIPFNSLSDKALKNLQELNLKNTDIRDITSLKKLWNLQKIDFTHTKINDISVLKDLRDLLELKLYKTEVIDINALQSLKNLQLLDLSYTKVSDFSVLKELKNLQVLNLSYTKISNISVLHDLQYLQELILFKTGVNNINVLKDLKNLQVLDLGSTEITDISVLKELKDLQQLNLSGTYINNVIVLKYLTKLQNLYLNNTKVCDVSSLKNLKNLQTLYLSGTEVSDVSVLKDLKNLQLLVLSGTKVSDVSPLDNLSNLKIIK